MAEEKEGVSFKFPGFEGSARGSNTVALLTLLGVTALGYADYSHSQASKEASMSLVAAIREMTAAQVRMVAVQREMSCLLSLPMERREREYFSPNSFCKSISTQ